MTQQLRLLGRSGLKVSPLCLGTMNFGDEQFGCNEKTAVGITHAFLDGGHNFIDTSDGYSATRAESIVGRAVKGRRDAVVIGTRAAVAFGAGHYESWASRKHLLKACEGSLRRLGTDYIDLYQIHCYDDSVPVEETLATLNDLVRHGKVRYVGVSNWSASQIVEACAIVGARGWEPLVSLEQQYNILVRDIEVEIVPVCQKFGLGVIAWSPLGGGMLTGKYKAGQEPEPGTRLAAPGSLQPLWRARALNERNHAILRVVVEEARKLEVTPLMLALAWNLARAGVVAPIIGPKSEQQLWDNLAALEVTLPAAVIERIDAVSQPYLPYPHDFQRMLRQQSSQHAGK